MLDGPDGGRAAEAGHTSPNGVDRRHSTTDCRDARPHYQAIEQLEDARSIAVQYVMNTLRAITVRLDPVDYARLETEAEHLGVPPATLVRMYVRASLNGDDAEVERRRRIGLQALDRLAELTADLPAVDAVQIAQESREALDARPSL